MIIEHEGLGGFTLEVRNGDDVKRFECGSYVVVDRFGTPWFDFDAALTAAQAYDRAWKDLYKLKETDPELYAYLFEPVQDDPEADELHQARQFAEHFAQTHELDPVEDASIIQLLSH